MKKLILILLLFSLPLLAGKEPQKFKTTFTLTFEDMTLEQAAEIEKKLSKIFEDASVNISLSKEKKIEPLGHYFQVDSIILSQPYYNIPNGLVYP